MVVDLHVIVETQATTVNTLILSFNYANIYAISPMIYFFSSPEHEVLKVNSCDHSPSVRRQSIRLPLTFSCLHSNIYKYQPISTKFGQNT